MDSEDDSLLETMKEEKSSDELNLSNNVIQENSRSIVRKRKHTETKTPALKNPHLIKKIVKAMETFGTHDTDRIMRMKVVKKYKKESIEAFLNTLVMASSTRETLNLEEGNDAEEAFDHINYFAESMSETEYKTNVNHAIPLALRTIAFTENHPPPTEVGGVDFQLMYKNLANLMMGQPAEKMNTATSNVLIAVYKSVSEEIELTDSYNNDSYRLVEAFHQMNNGNSSGNINDLLFDDQ